MAMCEHGHEHHDFQKGVFDLLDVCQLLRDGDAWKLALELGLAEDHEDKGWRMTEKGAKICALAMLMNTELVTDHLEEEEQEPWRNSMLTNMGRVVTSMTQRGLLTEEVSTAMDMMKEEAAEQLKERMEKPPLPGWVELN